MKTNDWFVGLWEGEGNIYCGIDKRWRSRYLIVSVSQPSAPEVLRWCQDKFGGVIYKRKYTNNPKWLDVREWRIYNKDAERIAVQVLLPAVSKRRQKQIRKYIRAYHTYMAPKKKTPR